MLFSCIIKINFLAQQSKIKVQSSSTFYPRSYRQLITSPLLFLDDVFISTVLVLTLNIFLLENSSSHGTLHCHEQYCTSENLQVLFFSGSGQVPTHKVQWPEEAYMSVQQKSGMRRLGGT